MKKTRNKIFITIFSILTILTLYVFTFAFYQNYKMQKDTIENILVQMNMFEQNKTPYSHIEPDKNNNKIYLGYKVYTIILDSSGNYYGIINYTNNDSNIDEVIKKSKKIIKNGKSNISISNLIFNKYVYSYTSNNTINLIDISTTNETLKTYLLKTIILIIMSEIIIIFTTVKLTKWIMKPVKESFEKQKQFIADASHELKTPISVMLASAEMYYQDKNVKWVDNMKSESERMENLVKNLLELSKTEQDNIILSNLNISKIIENSILTFESLFYEKKIKLTYNIEDNIYYKCNEEQIKELMSILIDNAIKHCDKKGYVNIFLSKNNKKDIVLKVENTGNAIPTGEEEKIFERFYRSDSSRNRDSNRYGLGLAIAKNIVTKNNGNITAHSEAGITTFKVTWNQK
jgi:two-component system, OmpR family, sensor histidine kinase CiaH